MKQSSCSLSGVEKLQVMSDLCMYEFEDIAWDDICPSDDHTVPHPGKTGGIYGLVDTKRRHEVVTSLNIQDSSAGGGYVYHTSENGEFQSLSEGSKKLDKGISSSSMDGDSIQGASCVASDDLSSSHAFKTNDRDPRKNGFRMNFDDKTATADNNSFSYPLADATHAENNLAFFENAGARDSGDLLYYDWPEIGNFEDVDKMFRSCDSTFGLEGSKDDGFNWLSSADDVGEFKDEMESDTSFTLLGNNDSKSVAINDPAMNSASDSFSDDIWSSDESQSYLSFVNGTTLANGKNGFTAKGQMINNRNQSKLQQHSGGKRKGDHPASGSFSYSSNLSNETTQVPPKATSHLDFSSGVMRQRQALSPVSYGYTQNPFTYRHLGSNSLPGPKVTNQPTSAMKSEIDELASLSPIGAAGLPSKLLCKKNIGSSQTIPADFGSSNLQESPVMSSRTDDNSMEAASFRQLQLVMEQLDMKTKLCIRDSLYRLARSAEHRHNEASLCSNGDGMEGNGALMGEDASNFVDMETQTNPIDRSVAHLLFHRAPPSEQSPSNLPSTGSMACSGTKAENLVLLRKEMANGEIG